MKQTQHNSNEIKDASSISVSRFLCIDYFLFFLLRRAKNARRERKRSGSLYWNWLHLMRSVVNDCAHQRGCVHFVASPIFRLKFITHFWHFLWFGYSLLFYLCCKLNESDSYATKISTEIECAHKRRTKKNLTLVIKCLKFNSQFNIFRTVWLCGLVRDSGISVNTHANTHIRRHTCEIKLTNRSVHQKRFHFFSASCAECVAIWIDGNENVAKINYSGDNNIDRRHTLELLSSAS